MMDAFDDASLEARGEGWPVSIDAVTETIVATKGPNDRWNLAALGLFPGEPVTAITWGRTRTRRNFERVGSGIIQFSTDPVDFVDAALSIVERDDPILPTSHAAVEVDVDPQDEGVETGTTWKRWSVRAGDHVVSDRQVPTLRRGRIAVVEATIAVSRLGRDGFDDETLDRRLELVKDVVERTGSERDRIAIERVETHR